MLSAWVCAWVWCGIEKFFFLFLHSGGWWSLLLLLLLLLFNMLEEWWWRDTLWILFLAKFHFFSLFLETKMVGTVLVGCEVSCLISIFCWTAFPDRRLCVVCVYFFHFYDNRGSLHLALEKGKTQSCADETLRERVSKGKFTSSTFRIDIVRISTSASCYATER